MKKYYMIDGDTGQRFGKLWDVMRHVTMMSKRDALGYDGMYVIRVIEHDGRSWVDENFCRVLEAKLDRDGYVCLKMRKVSNVL